MKYGRVRDAEEYMEIRRILFRENGYPIRKLNQAYFAFHGSYGTGAAATSPIGPKLERLRSLTPDLRTFSRSCVGSPLSTTWTRQWQPGSSVGHEIHLSRRASHLSGTPNRFRIVARLHSTGEVVTAHCPDPGRLRELLIPDGNVTVYVSRAAQANDSTPAAPARTTRKTLYDLRFVVHPESGVLISLDTRVPNQIVAEALAARTLPPFAGLSEVARGSGPRSNRAWRPQPLRFLRQ